MSDPILEQENARGAEADRDRLASELGSCEGEVQFLKARIADLEGGLAGSPPQSGVPATADAEIAALRAEADRWRSFFSVVVVEWFKGGGGVNYFEATIVSEEVGNLILTLQRQQGATPHELRARAEKESTALRNQLAEKNAALVAAGESLATVATKTYLRQGSGERYQQCAYCKEWAEETDESVEHDAACPVGRALSAPALARAVEFDAARREVCAAVARWRESCVSDDFKMREQQLGEVVDAHLRFCALEARP